MHRREIIASRARSENREEGKPRSAACRPADTHVSAMSSALFQVSREDLPSPSPHTPQPNGDGDSGFDELIDDAAAFEFTPPVSRVSPLAAAAASHRQLQILHEQQLLQQQQQQHVAGETGGRRVLYPYRSRSNEVVSSDSAYSTTTPEYSPLSPSPRPLATDSVSSSGSTQPDSNGGVAAGSSPNGIPDGRGEVSGRSPLSPSPAGSEEDMSGKGEDIANQLQLAGRLRLFDHHSVCCVCDGLPCACTVVDVCTV